MIDFMLYIGTHSIGTFATLLHIIIIIIFIIITTAIITITGIDSPQYPC